MLTRVLGCGVLEFQAEADIGVGMIACHNSVLLLHLS